MELLLEINRSQQMIKTPFMELNTYNMDVQLVSCLKTLAVIHRIIELYVSLLSMIHSVSY